MKTTPSHQAELTIDLGEVGDRFAKHPFRVRLECTPLADLIRAAEAAHRVYELLLIDRPGDVWEYVRVMLDAVPPGIAERVAHARQRIGPRGAAAHPWAEGTMPFNAFEELFFRTWDDSSPEEDAWLRHRETPVMRSFARQVLAVARAAQDRLDGNDELLRHVVARVRAGELAYCYVDRALAKTRGRESGPGEATHSPSFYDQLGALLKDPDIASVAYRANGDHRILPMMATEQRRRAKHTGHSAGHALRLSALVNTKVDNEAWDSDIWFPMEGLSHGDLYIQGVGLGLSTVKDLVEVHHRLRGRYILASQDEGTISGFDKTSGDGWVLYRRQHPETRRRALERNDHRDTRLGPILAFSDEGATLFEYEKAVLVIGESVTAAARAVLADVIAEWQHDEGDPLLMVLGDATPFDLAGCRDVKRVPQDLNDAEALSHWLHLTLHRARPWIDAVIALDAPPWALQVLEKRCKRASKPWSPWIVATEGTGNLKADFTLGGDLAVELKKARQRAQRSRPGWR